MPREPAVTRQAVSFTTTTQSAAFQKETTLISVESSADCFLEFGTNPTATTSKLPLKAGVEKFRAVRGGHKVAAVTAS